MTVMWPLTCSHSCQIAAPARSTANGKLPVPLMHQNVSGDRKEGKTSAYLASCVIGHMIVYVSAGPVVEGAWSN